MPETFGEVLSQVYEQWRGCIYLGSPHAMRAISGVGVTMKGVILGFSETWGKGLS